MLSLKPSFSLWNKFSNLRLITTSSALWDYHFRLRNKLPMNSNAGGPLHDGPDFTYLDSNKPTPLSKAQMTRQIKHRQLAETFLKLNEEIQFSVEKKKQLDLENSMAKQKIINSKLKPKGNIKHTKKSRN